MPAAVRTQTWKHRMNRGDVVVLTLKDGSQVTIKREAGWMVVAHGELVAGVLSRDKPACSTPGA